jgi:hypothetical protein
VQLAEDVFTALLILFGGYAEWDRRLGSLEADSDGTKCWTSLRKDRELNGSPHILLNMEKLVFGIAPCELGVVEVYCARGAVGARWMLKAFPLLHVESLVESCVAEPHSQVVTGC